MPIINEVNPDSPDGVDAPGQNTGAGAQAPVPTVGTPTAPMPPLTSPITGCWPGGVPALTLKQGDYGSWLHLDIQDANGPVNLTGSVIVLRLRGLYDSVPKVAAGAAIEVEGHGKPTNVVEYQIANGDTSEASDYTAEVAITWTDGTVRTSNLLSLSIVADVG